jgi:nuclear pore complex protein Nup205
VHSIQVTKDAVHGSEAGKAISFYVLDALISVDHDKYFLNQLQSRGILRSCLSDITTYLSKVCIATALSFSKPADASCRLYAIMHSSLFFISLL